MLRSTMFLLCLIAALSGSPLRHAEAAGDLARSMAELVGGDVIETIDGGVGDDAGETILAASGRHGDDPLSDAPAINHATGFSPYSPAFSSPGSTARSSRPIDPPASDPARRYAWLQAFRC